MNVPVAADVMESVIIKGDLGKLTPDERVRYYGAVCESLGLNPLTKPFDYINLGGKLVLYPRRDCADQLRKLHNVNIEIVSRQVQGDILTVHARARMPDGRTDEDYGSVFYPDALKGEARANAEMKATTKAKRRVTLSICGLGWADENEIDELPVDDLPVRAHRRPPPPAPNALVHAFPDDPHPLRRELAQSTPYDPETGEVPPSALPANANAATAAADQAAPSDRDPIADGAVMSFEDMAREAAMGGEAAFKKFYKSRSEQERRVLNSMGDELRDLMT